MQEQTHQLKMEVLPQGGDSAAGGQRTSLGQTGPPGGPGGPTATSTATRVSQQAATPQQPTVLFTAPQQILPHSPPHQQLGLISVSHHTSQSPGSTNPAAARFRKNGLVIQHQQPPPPPPPPQQQQQQQQQGGTQTLALQQANGNVSILHVQLPQSQSVIQPASHAGQVSQAATSVIQATSATGTTIQNLKNPVILVNKGSVIQSAAGGQQLAEDVPVQLVGGVNVLDGGPGGTAGGGQLAEDEGTRKRREVLARRPSYRKIFNELSMPQHHDSAGLTTTIQVVAGSSSSDKDDTASDSDFQVKPASIHLQTASEFAPGSGGAQYVQYSNDTQLFVPVTVSGVAVSDLQTYQLRPAQVATAAPVVVAAGGVGVGSMGLQTTAGGTQPVTIAEEAARKRELRLLKNREAAKECRRKKKDYIKCLENRVAVLENQNATLIEELKALKDLYCKKSVNDM
ncbi:cyclic AMP-responsive element-binding protein 1-like isoform X2 [Varroa jacobsoni]|uniref:cyclic AMP-responsive element-binding protein 1-like isoform X2 n=1 Tax=Varroa jacobsoni TaxID=62625 RepID=UPI000BF45F4F|nr:cyclic AMP-responsive element-binding protein 1-like isoform X2 [Varroa jacobsoni]